MKPKFVIAMMLAVAVIAAMALWLRRPSTKHAQMAAVQRPAVSPSKSAFLHPLIMATVIVPGGRSVKPKQSQTFNPNESVWFDIRLIVDDSADYRKRLEAIHRLPSKLTDADWQILRGFLLKPDVLDNDQLGQVLKNDIMDKLCLMEPVPNGMEDLFVQMYRDQQQNEVVRDYAVQHLATYDQNLRPQKNNAEARQTAQKVLWGALDETGDSIAGTALLGLERLSQQNPGQVDQKKLEAAALQLANSGTAGELTQITAYQVCAQLNVQGALPAIESAAQASPTMAAQISAIGALGLLGGANDIPLLQNLMQDSEGRLKLPVQVAIQRIEQRTGASAPVKSS